MKVAVRQGVLLVVLTATVLAAVWPDAEPESPPQQRKRADPTLAPPSAGRTTAASAPLPQTERRDRGEGEVAVLDPFATKSWSPPTAPPPAPVVIPAAAPTAPPLPFSYAGRLEVEPGRWVFYLVRGEQTFAISKGEVFDGAYRFEGTDGDSLLIRYVPLSIIQPLRFSTEN